MTFEFVSVSPHYFTVQNRIPDRFGSDPGGVV